jgi:hypothetical protein
MQLGAMGRDMIKTAQGSPPSSDRRRMRSSRRIETLNEQAIKRMCMCDWPEVDERTRRCRTCGLWRWYKDAEGDVLAEIDAVDAILRERAGIAACPRCGHDFLPTRGCDMCRRNDEDVRSGRITAEEAENLRAFTRETEAKRRAMSPEQRGRLI